MQRVECLSPQKTYNRLNIKHRRHHQHHCQTNVIDGRIQ